MYSCLFAKKETRNALNYRGISLFSIPGKINANCLEKRCREIFKTQFQDAQYGFCPGRSTMDQIFALKEALKLWKYAKEVYTCFADLEKAYDCVLRDKLWAVLLEYDVRGQLLASKSLSQKSMFMSIT